ncbi:BREX system Lon protease-like protein BrxL [Moorella naiadis]|uniref:BREX system Lon protease-like protein BrxL n=1 Tax=Moorella naiadis (nom. illeg.) TaxID=3093670 RepID=UPI003D9C91DF
MSFNNAVQDKTRTCFQDMIVYKDPTQNKFFASLSIPPYLRDWMIMRFADESGRINLDEVSEFVKKNIPGKKDWELLKSRMVNDAQRVRFLAKLQVEIDVRTGEGLFYLPDLGFPNRKHEAIVSNLVLRQNRKELLSDSETWGVIECEWSPIGLRGKEGDGAIYMTDYKIFQPYKIDVEYFQEARKEFTLDEWIDMLLLAVDYNPNGFLDTRQKLTLLSRLLPFVEKRVNLIELAPKGTGKSYLMSQISKYGWLVSGGSISRARLFYDISRNAPGLVSRYDYIAFDEIQTISFPDVDEIRGALKGYLESGEYRVGDKRGIGDAGLVLMGNISDEKMNEYASIFTELPYAFQESALIDRFHGFIKGWDIPRMRENMKAEGWALNVEYFSEVMHAMRNEIVYPALVDALLDVPGSGDTRDTTAIKRICSGFMKLLFPHVKRVEDIDKEEFRMYCLAPAIQMRSIIKCQLHLMDSEYSSTVPEIKIR